MTSDAAAKASMYGNERILAHLETLMAQERYLFMYDALRAAVEELHQPGGCPYCDRLRTAIVERLRVR